MSAIKYIAIFSNGTQYETNTKRPTSYAWRVEWKRPNGDIGDAGGFSATRENAEKAMNAWIARINKCPYSGGITFKEVAKANPGA